jgi:ribosomal protein S18 acetylase RimI-like enzyme
LTVHPMTADVTLRRLSSIDDLGPVADLMAGYIAEIRRNMLTLHGIDLRDIAPDPDLLVEIAGLLAPPHAIYVAEVDGRPAGTGGLKQIGPDLGEIKRMYVDPAFRGRGAARAIVERLVADGQAAGYRALRLESAVWMVEAHALYRSCGFTDAPPFPDPEFGCFPGYEHLARYMTLNLEVR